MPTSSFGFLNRTTQAPVSNMKSKKQARGLNMKAFSS